MMDAITNIFKEKVDCDINNYEFIVLIIDVSTDVTVHKKLNSYVKCLNEINESYIHFRNGINMIDEKAKP